MIYMRLKTVLVLCILSFILGVGVSSYFFISAIGDQPRKVLPAEAVEYQGTVTRVIDGETIQVDEIRGRLVGVETQERGKPGFDEATEFTASLCPVGSTAILDIDDLEPKDKYGRTLAVVYCNGVHVNAELLREGYAEVLYIPPSEFDPYSW
jgi:micrococcal nuclease